MREISFEEIGIQNKPIIFRTNIKNKIAHCNKNFARLLGTENKEDIIENYSLEDLIMDLVPERIWINLINTLSEGKPLHSFVRMKRINNDEYVWIELIGDVHKENEIKSGYGFICKEVSLEDKQKYEKEYGKVKG